MLRWVSLLVCCVVAVHLAAVMGEVTCETLKSGVPIAIPSLNGSLTPPTVLLEKCRWDNVVVQLVADGPFVVVLRDVHLVGGSLTVVVSGGMEEATVGSSLILQSSTLIGCSKCLCVSSASASIYHVDLVVAHSIIQANESAATLDAPYIRDSSIRVTDSTVEVNSQANAVAASAITARADNVRIEAINSNVAATTTNGMACSIGFISNSSGSTANNATLCSANSSVTATGRIGVASMGFATHSRGGNSAITANNVTLCAANSSVTAVGSDYSVASMGFASYSDSAFTSTITANNAMLCATNCTVLATGGHSVASMGFTSLSFSSSTSIIADSATLYSVNSSVTAMGGHSVASMGFASNSDTTSTITTSKATFYAANSSVSTTGFYAVACMGFASYGSSSSSTIAADTPMLYAASTKVTAIGSDNSVACMGFASYSSSASTFSTVTANNATIFATYCVLTARGTHSVASMGFASYGSFTVGGSAITANNATLFAADSSLEATRGYYSVASMGFASYSGSSSTVIANNVTFYAANSSVTATGGPPPGSLCSAASMGFASYSAGDRSTITANNAMLYAANSRLSATGSYSVACMGFASRSSPSVSGISTIKSSTVVLVLCASQLFGSGGDVVEVVGSDPTPVRPYTARCLLVRSQIVMPDKRCVTLLDGHTEGALPSQAVDLSLQCGSVGTLPRCSHNVTGTSQTTVPSPSCPPYNSTTCDDVFPAPVRPSIVLALPGWISGGDLAPSRFAHSFSQTATAPLSRTATSVASQSTFSRRQGTVSMLASNNTCTMTSRSALSPSVTPSMAVLGAPSPRSDTVHVAAQLLGSEAAARAVVSSTSVSAAMSSVVSAPSAMASVSRVASLSKVVDCGFGAEIDGEDAVPDMLDLPVHPAVGSSRLRYYVGGVALTSSLLVLLPLLAVLGSHAKLGDTRRSRPTLMWLQRHIFTTFACVCVGFFGPPVVGDGVLLLFFSDAGDWGAAAVGALGVASVVVAWGFLAAGLWRLPLSIDSSNRTSVVGARLVWNFKRRMCVTLWCFAGSSRDLRGVARFYFSEEMLASCAMAAIANAPRVDGSCHGLAWSMAAVAAAHLAFVAVVRPYDLRLDNVWSLLVASLQVALSVVQTAVVYGADGRDVAAALVLALCAFFFLQAALGAMLECVALSRRRVQRVIQGGAVDGALEDNSDKEDGDCALTVPLTNNMNPLVDVVSPHASTENN